MEVHMSQQLPARPNLDQLRAQAKTLLSSFRSGDAAAVSRFTSSLPALSGQSSGVAAKSPLALHDAQSVLAREYGFKSWPDLVHEVERIRALEGITAEVADSFVSQAISDRFERCRRMLELYPGLPRYSAATALVWGDAPFVKSWLESGGEPAISTKIGPNEWLPLEYVCYSRLHSLGQERFDGLLETARLLLDAGADPNTSHSWRADRNEPLSVLFGAAGESGNVGIVRLLLERGANPNDGESVYHAAEKDRGDILELLLAYGGEISARAENWGNTPIFFLAGYRPSDPGWATAMKGIRWLLDHGADPNVACDKNQSTALHVASRTANAALVRLLIEHGANVSAKTTEGRTPFELASITGNLGAIEALREAGGAHELAPGEAVVAACAADDLPRARDILAAHPELISRIKTEGTWPLCKLAELGIAAGVRNLLEIGCDVASIGEGGATALHFACFCGWADCVDILLAHGAPLDVCDSEYNGDPLGWAIQAAGWHRNPRADYVRIVRSLLAAGADRDHILRVMDQSEDHAERLAELSPLVS
jgi:ankyrin repeat protein